MSFTMRVYLLNSGLRDAAREHSNQHLSEEVHFAAVPDGNDGDDERVKHRFKLPFSKRHCTFPFPLSSGWSICLLTFSISHCSEFGIKSVCKMSVKCHSNAIITEIVSYPRCVCPFGRFCRQCAGVNSLDSARWVWQWGQQSSLGCHDN